MAVEGGGVNKDIITLSETIPGDIVRLHPGHVTEYRGDAFPWYRNYPTTFLILSMEAHGELREWGEIAAWPIEWFDDPDGCSGNPALRFMECADVLCQRLGNIRDMIPAGWGDGYDIPFDARRTDHD